MSFKPVTVEFTADASKPFSAKRNSDTNSGSMTGTLIDLSPEIQTSSQLVGICVRWKRWKEKYIEMLKCLRIYNVGITLTGVTFHDCCQSLHTNSVQSVLTTSIDSLSNTSFTNLSFKYICCVIRTADVIDRSPKSMNEFCVITSLSIILSSEYLEATLWASWRIQCTVQWR